MSNNKTVCTEDHELFTVFVETLTGATYEIKVSPQDRVRSIKCKIQRVEGIPITHQHLLYNSKELKDTLCVTDPSVALHDQATIRLVLSMRGGPISLVHQTVPFSRSALRNLIKLNRREDSEDDLASGSKMAVLVLRVGDQLNLLHVVEDSDGTDSEEPHSSSFDSLLEGEPSKSLEENNRTMEKVCDLKDRMERLSLLRKQHKTNSKRGSKETEIAIEKPSCSLRLPSIQRDVKDDVLKTRSEFSQIPILPDIIARREKNTSRETEYLHIDDEAVDFNDDSVRPKTCPGALSESQCYNLVDEVECEKSLGISQPQFRSCVSACSSDLHHEWSGRKSLLQSLNIPPPISTVSNVLNEHRTTSSGRKLNSISTSVSSVENLDFDHRLIRSAIKSRETLRQDEVNVQKRDNRLENMRSFSSENVSCTEKPLHLWNSNPLFSYSNGTTFNASSSSTSLSGIYENSSNNKDTREEMGNKKLDFTNKKPKLRCGKCRKRLSVTSTFECRCGLLFCSLHRYSETHNCTYDFKKDSRKLLEQANPTVVAPKLPKI